MVVVRILALLTFSAYVAATQDPFSGEWSLNLAKSKLPPPLPKSQIVRVDADASRIRITEEVITDTGEHMFISVDAGFDGKDYPVKGSPVADSVAYRRVDRHTIKGVGKKAGKVVMRETVVVGPDGQTMTGTYTETDPSG